MYKEQGIRRVVSKCNADVQGRIRIEVSTILVKGVAGEGYLGTRVQDVVAGEVHPGTGCSMKGVPISR